MSESAHYGVGAIFLLASGVFGLIGWRTHEQGEPLFRRFALGAAGYALAFLGWAAIVVVRPADLALASVAALLPFALGNLALFSVGVADWPSARRELAERLALAYLGVVIIARLSLPSTPSFSAGGLIYLNAAPLVLLLYLGAFAGGVLPAIGALSRRIDGARGVAVRVAMTLLVLCGTVLLSSYDDALQLLNGTLMGLALLALAALFARPLPRTTRRARRRR